MRLIDADKLRDAVTYIPWCDYIPLQRAIDEAQTIEAEPVKHGVWRPVKHIISGNTYDYICSNCGCNYAMAEYTYCPSCGAKMDGQEEIH